MKHGKKGRAQQLGEAQREIARLNYEMGRLEKAVDTRNKVIRELQGDVKLAELKEQSNEALVALLLKHIGADKAHPVVLEHRAVREALSEYRVLMTIDEEKQTYALYFVAVS